MGDSVSWDEFRLVKAIADSGSLVGAASALDINHSTVFRRLGALETAMGTALFERTRGGYAPTAAGEAMIALARRMAADIVDFERALAGRDEKPAGRLRVTTNDAFAAYLLAPTFASFVKAYPAVMLDVIVAHQPLNLSRRDADIAIRATSEPPETLVGRRIANIGWHVYAAREVGGAHGWVGFGDGLALVSLRDALEQARGARPVVCRCDSMVAAAQALRAGMGAGALPCFIGEAVEGLVRMDGPVACNDQVWLLTHPDLRNATRVRAFMDHAAGALARLKGVIEGGAARAKDNGGSGLGGKALGE